MRRVHVANTPREARLLRDELAAKGIAAEIVASPDQGDDFPPAEWTALAVREPDAPEAERLLAGGLALEAERHCDVDEDDERPPLTAPERRELLSEVAVVAALLVLPYYAWAFAYGVTGRLPMEEVGPWDSFVHGLVLLAQGAALVLVVHRWRNVPLSAMGLRSPVPRDVGMGLWVFAVAAAVDAAFASMAYGAMYEPTFEAVREHGAGEMALLLVSIVPAALFEEILWRGWAIPRLERLLDSTGLAVFVSAAAFAAAHAGSHGPVELLPVFLFGVVVGVAFVVTRNLWPVVVAHVALNVLIALLW